MENWRTKGGYYYAELHGTVMPISGRAYLWKKQDFFGRCRLCKHWKCKQSTDNYSFNGCRVPANQPMDCTSKKRRIRKAAA